MGDWALGSGGNRVESVGQDLSISGYLDIGADRGTKGSWTQIVDATPYPTSGVALHLGRSTFNTSASGDATRYLVDLAIGPPGSEQPVISDLLYLAPRVNRVADCLVLPLALPAGARVAGRAQFDGSLPGINPQFRLGLSLLGSAFASPPGYQRLRTYGADTSGTRGTQINPGTTANTKGEWVEIAAATDAAARALLVAFGHPNNRDNVNWLVDIGVGPVGSEQVLIPDILVCGGGTGVLLPRYVGPLPVSLPPGTRLSVRAASTATNADRLFDVILYTLG